MNECRDKSSDVPKAGETSQKEDFPTEIVLHEWWMVYWKKEPWEALKYIISNTCVFFAERGGDFEKCPSRAWPASAY